MFSSTIKLNVSNEMRIYKHVYNITNSIETILFIYVLYTPIYAKIHTLFWDELQWAKYTTKAFFRLDTNITKNLGRL